MKGLLLPLFLLLACTILHGQDGPYSIECVSCEPIYGETDCATCPGNSGVGVTLFDGIIIRDWKTGKEMAYIPAPFKPKLSGGYVEIYTQTNEEEVNGLPTEFRARFGEYVLSDYSGYGSFMAMADSLASCGGCSSAGNGGTVESVTGTAVDNTDPGNPVIDEPALSWVRFELVLADGQTSFTSTNPVPESDAGVFLFLNGLALNPGDDWTRVGNTYTFTGYVGKAGHKVWIQQLVIN